MNVYYCLYIIFEIMIIFSRDEMKNSYVSFKDAASWKVGDFEEIIVLLRVVGVRSDLTMDVEQRVCGSVVGEKWSSPEANRPFDFSCQ